MSKSFPVPRVRDGQRCILRRLSGPFRILNGAPCVYLGKRMGYHFIRLEESRGDYPARLTLNVLLEQLDTSIEAQLSALRRKVAHGKK